MFALVPIASVLLIVGPVDERVLAPASTSPEPPWASLVLENCAAQLAAAGVREYDMIPGEFTERMTSKQGTRVCHVPQALQYVRGPGDIRYTTYMLVNCRMATALARFEEVAQRTAVAVFGKRARVRTVKALGAYACRPVRENRAIVSQHSYGNALDIQGFTVERAGAIDVATHWSARGSRRDEAKSLFLQALTATLLAERVFLNVITPGDDPGSHGNHLHLDLDAVRTDLDAAPVLDDMVWDAADVSPGEERVAP